MGHHRLLWILAVIALIRPAAATAQDPGDAEVQRLAVRAKMEHGEPLRRDLLALQRKHPGTAAAIKAAALLRDLPSPLDKLDAKAIPELERFAWHPKETVAILGEHRGRQAGAVTCTLFSRSGKWLASGSNNGYIRIWDPRTMRLKHTLGHSGGAYCLAVSKDSGLLAVGGGDGQVRLWNMSADPPKDKGLLKVSSTPLLGLSLAPNGKTFVAGGSDSRVYLWDLTSDPPKELNGGSGHSGVIRSVLYSPSGKLIASAGDDKFIRLWTVNAQHRMTEKAKVETPAAVQCLAFHPTDDKVFVSGGADGTIRLWQAGEKLTQKAELKTKHGAVHAIAISASGKTLAAAFSGGTVRTWAFGTKLAQAEKAILEGHKAAATAVAFAPDGTLIATGSADWTVRLWPGVSGIKPRDKTIAKGHLSHVYTVAFHPDGAGLASGSYDASVRQWECAGEVKEHVAKLKEEGAIYTLAYAPDGKLLAAGGAAAMFRTCDVPTGRFLFGFKDHTRQISRLAWSPDGKRIASCSNDKTVRLWDGHTGKAQSAITTFKTPVHTVAFSPNGKQLVCTSGAYLRDQAGQIVIKGVDPVYDDSAILVYDAESLEEHARVKFVMSIFYAVAYSPDSRAIFAGGSEAFLRRWDADKRQTEPQSFTRWGSGGLSTLACSPDGRWLAAYGPDYRVTLFDAASGKKVRDWAIGEQFGSLAFAPDSRHLAIGVASGIVLVLRLDHA
jgi:WD40 repeat protein